jgi:mono/diheme cytochrome c family protein
MERRPRIFILVAIMGSISLLLFAQTAPTSRNSVQSGPMPATTGAAPPQTTTEIAALFPVQGPSWIRHLGLSVSKTHMGQLGGDAALTANGASSIEKLRPIMQRFLSTVRSDPQQASRILDEEFTVSGADIYRWNCQGCHGTEGKGMPPEINSVLGPVQGTSEAMTRARMEARGLDVDDDMIKQVTELARQALRDRLQHGGTNMPAFSHLRPDEIQALTGYLEKLASVPGAKDDVLVHETAARAGEHILRGTCHICHDGTGPGAGATALMQGNVPSLASLPQEHSLSGVVHQVQYGSCNSVKLTGSDVMPAYPYFSEEEVTAAFFATSTSPQKSSR